MSDVEELVKREPWRTGQGQPLNALDPTWNIERSVLCDGEVGYEGGTHWWFCTKCGYCSKQHITYAHQPIVSPLTYFRASMEEFLQSRREQGVDEDLANNELFHVMGVAVRYATHMRSGNLAESIQKMVR